MRSYIKRFYLFIVGFLTWGRTTKKNPGKTQHNADEGAKFRFRKVLLEKLDSYFVILRRMKKAAPEDFALYRRIGMHLIGDDYAVARQELSAWFRETRPSFGAVAWGLFDNSKNAKFTPKLSYFTKYKTSCAPTEIQPVNRGDVYVLTVYWDEPEEAKFVGRKRGIPTQFPVLLDSDGSVRILRTRMISSAPIRAKSGHNRGKIFHIPTRQWGYDRFFERWSSEHGENVETFLTRLFILTANWFELANMSSMIRVSASKNNIAAVFSVDVRRTAYFFQDRERTQDGKKRIFHAVRSHSRTHKSKSSDVRLHFRGARNFVWNGYDVNITVPGLHHRPISDFNVGALDSEHCEEAKPREMIGMAAVGNILHQETKGEGSLREIRAGRQ